MPDPVHELYQARAYPAMSHPATDPAVTSVSAALAGLEVVPPSGASILEIGCASGHNLLPLAARWPLAQFTGIDFSKPAIDEARESAWLTGMTHVNFIEADLLEFDPGNGVRYDYIIAHGIYSWVPEDVRQALLDFCAKHLSARGVAFVSYNTLPGWSLPKSLVDLAKQLSLRSNGQSAASILAQLAMATGDHNSYARHLNSVLLDMFGKGEDVLGFDDFSPINDPCSFLEFAGHASSSKLRYLGESQLSENIPLDLPPSAMEVLRPLTTDPLLFQQMVDVLTNRKFRRSILCRADAPICDQLPVSKVLDFSIRCPHRLIRDEGKFTLVNHAGKELVRFDQALAMALFDTLAESSTQALPIHQIIRYLADRFEEPTTPLDLARLILHSARKEWVTLRQEPVIFDTAPPAFPNLGALRLLAAKQGRPLVDAFHAPCSLDDPRKQQLSVAMDGTKRIDELADFAKRIGPDFDFTKWLAHLAARGMFVESVSNIA